MRKERLENLSLDVRAGSERQSYSDEFVFSRWFDFYEFTKISRFRRMKKIMCNGDYFVMNPLFNFAPLKGFKCGSNVRMFRGAGESAGMCIFHLLKAFNLRERKSVVKRVRIVKTRVNKGSSDSSGSGKVRSVTDTTKVKNVVMIDARKEGNLFGKS